MKKHLTKELDRIRQRLIRKYHPEKIILFGSLVSGKTHPGSDIDLAIIKKTRRRFLDRLKDALFAAQPKEGLDILVYTPEEVESMESNQNPFWLYEIKEKGQTLYQRG